ncbi:MAG TPA: hypothetical protein VNI84_18270 [Pyrinomonadaceae bacterium]|nr:hypothetical protein [Pyrinomonadaceae bacterium]
MKNLLLIFSLLLSSCVEYRKPELSIPDQKRDEIFQRFVNPLTEKYEIEKLREKYLSGDDFEVRVWIAGFEIDGFILRRTDSNWSANAIKEIDCKTFNYYQKDKVYELGKINLPTPKSGWENTWQKLVETGILDLPHSDEISYIDGMSYFTEINQNGKYRIYTYSNPDSQKTEEAKRMRKIGEIVADEFGLHNFKIGSLCLEK